MAALVERYAAAAAPLAARVVGRMTGAGASATETPAGEQVLGDLIADAQLAATARRCGRRADRLHERHPACAATSCPAADGSVTYGQMFAAQPFGNSLVVKSFTGAPDPRAARAAIRQRLEQRRSGPTC